VCIGLQKKNNNLILSSVQFTNENREVGRLMCVGVE